MVMNEAGKAFARDMCGKRVTVCGIGTNNTPVVRMLLELGAVVTACDKRTREQLGTVADEMEAAGVTLCLGENYLSDLQGDIVIRTPGMKPYLPELLAARDRGITVTSEMELFMKYCPVPMIAVTGSDGKTTSSTVIAGMLQAGGKTVHLGGNIGRPLLPILGDIGPQDAVVAELSSFQLTGMVQSPQTGVITNVAPNHLDWHTDMQEYIDAKRNLVAHQDGQGRAVLNADNDITASYAENLPGQVYWFSRRRAVPRGAYLRQDGMLCLVQDGQEIPVLAANEIKIPGVHNVENYLGAFAALSGKVDLQVMAQYARTFAGVKHRCELVRELGGVRWYNDSIGSSPSRTIAGLLAFDRKVILIAGGYDKHIPYDPLGPVAAKTVKTALLLGATAPAIEKAIGAAVPCERVADMEQAVARAAQIAQQGDIVFMSPASASFDMYKNFEQRGEHFRSLVLAL